MIEIVEELVELISLTEAWLFGDDLVVGREKRWSEPTKHGANPKVKLMMAVQGRWVKDNCKWKKARQIRLSLLSINQSFNVFIYKNFYIQCNEVHKIWNRKHVVWL